MTDPAESLDAIALRHGTAKASHVHGFTRLYEQFFAPRRGEPLTLLEIGVGDGASLRTWREYFANARAVYGLDVDPACPARVAGPGIEVVVGDQNDRDLLDALGRRAGGFDVVIDDGSHTWQAQVTAFEALWPHVRPEGLYVVEDLHTSYWPAYAAGPVRAVDYFKQLVDIVNLHGRSGYGLLANDDAAADLDLGLYERTVESVSFFKSIVFIRRRPRERVRPASWRALPGRLDPAEVYRAAADTARDGDHFVEVGARGGKSTAFLAVAAHNAGARVRLDVIDPWAADGSLDRFVGHLRRAGVLDEVNPVRVPQGEAAALYPDGGLDFVFLDPPTAPAASEGARRWLPKVKPGKVLAGRGWDDPAVRQALCDALGDGVSGRGPGWVCVRPAPAAGARRVYDAFVFFNELELLEVRLHELADVVDRFVLVESPLTYSGKPKPLHFDLSRGRFAPFLERIAHVVVEDVPRPATPFEREAHQRDAIARGLKDCHPDDLVLVSDVDEIPRAGAVRAGGPGVRVLAQRLAYYFLDTACPEPWCGTRLLSYADFLRRGGAQAVRHTPGEVVPDAGWHFSFMGGAERIREKLGAYAHVELASFADAGHVRDRLRDLGDLFNRGIRWAPVSPDTLPAHVLHNRDRFAGWFYQGEGRP
jgi:predicted O-methyltransferase YrrM